MRPGLKSANKPELITKGKTITQAKTFINDAAHAWNCAPNVIKECKTLSAVKTQIKIYIRTLPI